MLLLVRGMLSDSLSTTYGRGEKRVKGKEEGKGKGRKGREKEKGGRR